MEKSFPIAKEATLVFKGIVNLNESTGALSSRAQSMADALNDLLEGILVVTNVEIKVE